MGKAPTKSATEVGTMGKQGHPTIHNTKICYGFLHTGFSVLVTEGSIKDFLYGIWE